jgi:hypothetical protein
MNTPMFTSMHITVFFYKCISLQMMYAMIQYSYQSILYSLLSNQTLNVERTERIHLCLQAQYGLHCTSFHETHHGITWRYPILNFTQIGQ